MTQLSYNNRPIGRILQGNNNESDESIDLPDESAFIF